MVEPEDEEGGFTVSEALRLIGHPLADGDFLRPGDGTKSPYRFNPQLGDPLDKLGLWIEVDGGGLVEPVRLRINPGSDGRFVVTGMVLGPSGRQELNSETLRRLRLPEIVRAFVDDWDPTKPPDPDGDQDEFLGYWLFKEYVVDAVAAAPAAESPARGPRDEDYRQFAVTYRRELARDPGRAMTAAARAHNISRTTANRWARACRDRGYLPPKERS